MSAQSFTKNHRDHSNDQGYQFEFFCDKCGNGSRSAYKTSSMGMAATVLRAAGALFGGAVRDAGLGASHLKDAFRGPAWDSAFAEAIAECRPKFNQCTLCGQWVCPQVCWNAERGLCEGCAPNPKEHAAKMQAEVAVSQARRQIEAVDQTRGADFAQTLASVGQGNAGASCAKCQATLASGARFCAECGSPVAQASAPKFCSGCGGALVPAAKFCAECGAAAQR
jgi:hypothetical protein